MDAEISPQQHRLQTCEIVGDLRIAFYDGENGTVATVYGDPDGLRSLATLLSDLAELDQQSVPFRNLSIGEGFHLHLTESRGLSSGSIRLDIGRSDPRSRSDSHVEQ